MKKVFLLNLFTKALHQNKAFAKNFLSLFLCAGGLKKQVLGCAQFWEHKLFNVHTSVACFYMHTRTRHLQTNMISNTVEDHFLKTSYFILTHKT